MIPRPGHKLGYTYDLSTLRSSAAPIAPAVHQTEALTRLAAWFQQSHKPYAGTILVLPTGGGKTFTAVQFLCSPTGPLSRGYKVLWLAHTHHLLEQAYAGFADGVGQVAAPRTKLTIRVVSGTPGHFRVADITPADDLVICTLPTMTRAYNNISKRHPALAAFLRAAGERLVVVFDEAHHAPAYSYRNLLTNLRQAHPQMYLLGLTATPTYSDTKKRGWLRDLFPQNILYQVTPQVLMAQGILAKPIIEQHATTIKPPFATHEYQKWLGSYRDIPENIITQLAESRERNQYIAQTYVNQRERYGKTIIFADRWFQCEQLKTFLEETAKAANQSVRVGTVYSHVDADPGNADLRNAGTADENKQTLEQFRRGELDVLINVRMLTEGTDVPDVQTIFLTRQTTSQILLTQMVGRGLRGPKFGGTQQAYIVSFIDNWEHLITWAEYQPLAEGGTDVDGPRVGERPPLQLLPIYLVEQLTRAMYSDTALTIPPFVTLLPVGWYLVEFEPLAPAGSHARDGNGAETRVDQDDQEPVRQFVLVFEHEQEAYEHFIEGLKIAVLTDFADSDANPETHQQRLTGWDQRYFGHLSHRIGGEGLANLFLIARHMAQNEQQPPPFFPFREREQHDLDKLAQLAIQQDLGPRDDDQRLRLEYERSNRYWQAFYSSYDLFKAHYDACLRRIMATGQSKPVLPPIDTIAPPDEPPEQVKQVVRQRDGQRCLCCGAQNILHVDHIQPRYYGGGHTEDNLQILCQTCNSTKGTETISFRTQVTPLNSPPDSFAILAFTTSEKNNESGWTRFLRRNVNFFYRCAAVQSVSIHTDHVCHIVLRAGNNPNWFTPYLKALCDAVRQGRPAGLSSIQSIRLSVAAKQPIYPPEPVVFTEQVIIIRTPSGVIRRVPIENYLNTRAGDGTALCVARLTDTLLLISDQGNCYVRTVADLPTGAPSSAVTSLHPYWHLLVNELIVAALALPEQAQHGYLVLATQTGRVKRLPLDPILAVRTERHQLQNPDARSKVRWAVATHGNDDLILVSRRGYMLRMLDTSIPVMNGAMAGISTMVISSSDEICGLGVAVAKAQLLCITASGIITLTSPIAISPNGKTDKRERLHGAATNRDTVIAAHTVTRSDHLLLVTSKNNRLIIPVSRVLPDASYPSRYQVPGLRSAESIVTALVIR